MSAISFCSQMSSMLHHHSKYLFLIGHHYKSPTTLVRNFWPRQDLLMFLQGVESNLKIHSWSLMSFERIRLGRNARKVTHSLPDKLFKTNYNCYDRKIYGVRCKIAHNKYVNATIWVAWAALLTHKITVWASCKLCENENYQLVCADVLIINSFCIGLRKRINVRLVSTSVLT